MSRRTLNDRLLKSIKAPTEGRTEIWDIVVPGFGIRITHTGRKTFVLMARYGGSKHPTRRELGQYDGSNLAEMRTKARAWIELIRAGRDPTTVEDQARAANLRKQANTFGAVADDFIGEKLARERRGAEVERDLRREFVAKWGKRPITEITDLDVLAIINEKKKTARVAAINLLALAKRLFNWAIDQRVYGLTTNPCASLKPARIIGKRAKRSRILSDPELLALWRATGRMRYPYGAIYRLLMLTALRKNEVAGAAWDEINLAEREWTIPAARMSAKGRDPEPRPHLVPITDEIADIIEGLPKFKSGKHLFSTTFGKKAVHVGDKVKQHVDARMLRTLRALAKRRGDDPNEVELAAWVNHDIRRTVRTNLSRLRCTEEAREAVMAHVRSGIKGVYDLHDYRDEKREALELWAGRLRSIVEAPPTNVVRFAASR
jgi:integrase